jgi:hypothetical protein
MNSESIKAIFTNLLFVIGVILIIFGFIQGTLTAVRLLTFDEYPLASYEESRCEMEFTASKPVLAPGEASMSAEEIATRQAKCETSLAHARKVKQTEHIVSSLSTLIAGTVLIWSFRRFIFS